jgi:Alpha/beta hydrolase domain
VQSEQELGAGGGPPDSAFYRRWEIAGGAHQDRFSLSYVGASADFDNQLPPGTHILNAPDPPHCLVNRSTKFLAVRAALHHMHVWLRDGVPPPAAPRVEFAGGQIARDAFGNALGGLRLPHVEAPVARYAGDFASSCAPLAGLTEFFDAATLAALYSDRAGYEAALREATDRAVQAGFILPADANTWYCADDYDFGGELAFTPFRDCDADGAEDPVDNCPHRPNPGQSDLGGTASASADGIGDACQCGDVSGNGIANGQDAHAIRRHGVGAEPNPLFVAPQHCDVTGNGVCNGQDANALQREALGVEPNPLFGQYACESAQGDL